jgi:translation initiation factor 3 subunit F
LAEILETLPKLDATTFERDFHSNLQDLLMVVYLNNLTRMQLGITERLHTVIPAEQKA